jgi:hypothetical protein
VVALDGGQPAAARHWLGRAMKINAHNVALFLSMNYEPAMPVISLATLLEEMDDVLDVAQRRNSPDAVRGLWRAKSDWIESDIGQIQALYLVRDLLHEEQTAFLDAARRLRAWDLYDNACGRIAEAHSGRVCLLRAMVRFVRRIATDLTEFAAVADERKLLSHSSSHLQSALLARDLPSLTPGFSRSSR